MVKVLPKVQIASRSY